MTPSNTTPVHIAELSPDVQVPTVSNLDISNRASVIQRLQELHSGVQQAYALRDTQRLEAGKILVSLRKTSKHGEWEPLLKELCKAVGMSRSTAHNYMNAAETGAVVKLKDGKTANGYPMDVIRHIFQTSIRTGNEHRALQCLQELDQSGSIDWVWYRLPIIASEDVGLARLGLQREIEDLRLQWKRKRNDSMFLSHRLFPVHAVLLLVRSMKSRLTDHALIAYYQTQQAIQITEADLQDASAAKDAIVIVDDDLDPHSKSGRKLGRRRSNAVGLNHFFDIGAKLNNESPAVEDPYKELARKALIAATRQTVPVSPDVAEPVPAPPEPPKKSIQSKSTDWKHHAGFIQKADADELYKTMLDRPEWQPHRTDGSTASAIYYGLSYASEGSGARNGEIPEIPSFLRIIADQIAVKVGMPVNYIQCHKYGPDCEVVAHHDPKGMIVPMLVLGQERTFRVGGTILGKNGKPFPPMASQTSMKDGIHVPEEEIILRHGSLLVFDGGHTIHSMLPAEKDDQFNPNGVDCRISILFRWTTPAMREFGTRGAIKQGSLEQYEAAKTVFRARLAGGAA